MCAMFNSGKLRQELGSIAEDWATSKEQGEKSPFPQKISPFIWTAIDSVLLSKPRDFFFSSDAFTYLKVLLRERLIL